MRINNIPGVIENGMFLGVAVAVVVAGAGASACWSAEEMNVERVLIADDEAGIRGLLRSYCEREGYEARTVDDGTQALAALEAERFAVAIVDLLMPGHSGIDVLRRAKEVQPDCEVIILTGYADLATALEALRLGAYDYIEKPVADLAHLGVVIGRALERRRLAGHNAALLRDLQEANTEIERRRRQELDYIRQIGQAMASALEVRDIVRVLVEAVYNSIRCDVAAALLLSDERLGPWGMTLSRQRLGTVEQGGLVRAMIGRLPEALCPRAEAARLEGLVPERPEAEGAWPAPLPCRRGRPRSRPRLARPLGAPGARLSLVTRQGGRRDPLWQPCPAHGGRPGAERVRHPGLAGERRGGELAALCPHP